MGWITRARDELQQAAAGRRELAARRGAALVAGAAETGASAGSWSGRRNEGKRDAQRRRDMVGLQAEGWEPEEVRRWDAGSTGMEIEGRELAGLLDGYRDDGAEVKPDGHGGWKVAMPGGEVRQYPAVERPGLEQREEARQGNRESFPRNRQAARSELDKEIDRLAELYPETSYPERQQAEYEAGAIENDVHEGPGFTEPPYDWEGGHDSRAPEQAAAEMDEESGLAPGTGHAGETADREEPACEPGPATPWERWPAREQREQYTRDRAAGPAGQPGRGLEAGA